MEELNWLRRCGAAQVVCVQLARTAEFVALEQMT
jgi:hypothetical protein